ncbi:MAG: hypothetical protein O2923_06745 [Verrucomicrobia bacterium]|nr:hypothetical protein [Verrucomicrobiota bacterium]MDA1088007.1 hypothetical protein [Verrucomicrobiota bacterium]
MIRCLRQRHRVIWLMLLVLLPTGFVAGLSVRDRPTPASAPQALAATDLGSWTTVRAIEGFWPDLGVTVHCFRFDASGAAAALAGVALTGPASLGLADPLLYWSPVAATADALPDQATLLGSVTMPTSSQFVLPEMGGGHNGHLILYSMGHQRVVASAPLAE